MSMKGSIITGILKSLLKWIFHRMFGSKMRMDGRKPTGRSTGDSGMERRLFINENRGLVCFTIQFELFERISVRVSS